MSESDKNLKKFTYLPFLSCHRAISVDFRNISSLLLQEHLEVFHISSVEPLHAILTFPF